MQKFKFRLGAAKVLSLLAGCSIILSACCNADDIPNLARQLNSSDARDRNDAALALARCGAKAGRAVPRLSQLLYDENIGVQSAAAYALRKIDTPQAREIMTRIDESRRQK